MMKYTKYLVAGLIACIFSFCAVRAQERKSLVDSPARKLQLAEFAIANLYVDKVDEGKMVEEAIIKMLEQLDPHSVYSDAEEVKRMSRCRAILKESVFSLIWRKILFSLYSLYREVLLRRLAFWPVTAL